MKIAINTDFGGFGLSDQAFEALLARKNIAFEVVDTDKAWRGSDYYLAGRPHSDATYINSYEFYNQRNDPDLIAVIEQLGEAANGHYASIKIVEIPDDIDWHIVEYDGLEHVAEAHRTWQ
jgi:hypothetical protein